MRKPLLFVLFAGLLSFNLSAQNVFNGGGDATSWDDPSNWSLGAEPVAGDDVQIPSNFNVVISTAGEVAASLSISSSSSLTINLGTDLVVGAVVTSTGISLDEATLINNGTLSGLSSSTNGLNVIGASTVTNNGRITLSGVGVDTDVLDFNGASGGIFNNFGTLVINDDLLGDDAIDMDAAATFNNWPGGRIEITSAGDASILICRPGAIFNNRGRLMIRDSDSEAICLENGVSFFNFDSGVIEVFGGDSDGIETDGTGDVFDNAGTIRLINIDSEAIRVDNINSVFINRRTGTILIQDPNEEGIDVDGTFTNNGRVTITKLSGSDEHIDVGGSAAFINNCLVTLNGRLSAGEEAITIAASGVFINNFQLEIGAITGATYSVAVVTGAVFLNNSCGVVNDGSSATIRVVGTTSQFINNGIYTSQQEVTNNNLGTMINNGEFRTPAGTYTAFPNSLTNNGIIGTGAIPATQSPDGCPALVTKNIPTMSEWGLILFGLLLASLVSVGMYRKKNQAIC